MKRLLLPVFALIASGTYAQTYFSDDFSGGIDAWTLTDSDGDASEWEISDYAAGDGQGNVASSASWAGSPLTPDNWMVSGAIDLSGAAASVTMKWVVKGQDQSWADENYTVYAATSSDLATLMASPVNFNEIIGTTPDGSYVSRTLDLSSLSGEAAVYVAFRHHDVTDQFRINIDDVEVFTPFDNDIKMVSHSVLPTLEAGDVSITGTVENNGINTITAFDVDWNDGTPHNETITATIAPGATYDFTHPTTLTAVAGSTYSMTICATIAGDEEADNNCVDATVSASSGIADRLPLIELFTSSTCPPCYTLNYSGFDGAGLNAGLEENNANDPSTAELAVIKYQVNWPGAGDHAFNSDVASRVDYYSIGAAPTVIFEGAAAGAFNSGVTTPAKDVPAFVEIAASHEVVDGVITVDVDVDPYVTITGATLHIALLDKEYAAGADGSFSNGETEFHHVLRKLLPTAGTTIPTLTDGVAYSTSESYDHTYFDGYPAQGSFELHQSTDQEVVVFLQAADGTILNAAVSTGAISPVGIDEDEASFELSVYPNPSSDNTFINLSLVETSDIVIEVYNSLGELVYSDNGQNLTSGNYTYTIDVADFSAGIYTVRTVVNNTTKTEKLSVQ